MSVRKHPRVITDHQFSNGCTVDGDRIDAALQEFQSYFNNIPSGALPYRFVQTQVVQGWNPQDPATTDPAGTHHLPYLEYRNWWYLRNRYNSLVVQQATDPTIQNVLRLKGTAIPGIVSTVQPDREPVGGNQFAWTTSFSSSKPFIIRDWSLILQTDNPNTASPVFDNDFTYDGATPPPGETAGDESRDLVLSIEVDSPFNPEDKQYGETVFLRRNFTIDYDRVSWNTLPAFAPNYNDMVPAGYAKGAPYGFFADFKLHIPCPAGSRVRWSVVIPRYDGDTVGQGSWGDRPWHTVCPSSTVTILESIER